MFESIINFFKKIGKQEKETVKSKDAAKERLHLVLMQDRANVSADFLDLMKQEIIEVIKKYIDVDENAIDVRLTNKTNGDGTNGAPALYANIPIVSIKEDVKRVAKSNKDIEENKKVNEEQTESQNDNNEQEQKVEENGQTEQPNETKSYENASEANDNVPNEQRTYENASEVNNNVPNEQRTYENASEVNNNVSNEQRAFENASEVNNNVPNEQRAFENASEANNNVSNEQRTFENVAEVNTIQGEQAKQTQVTTENREQVTGNYTRTF